MAVGEPVVGNAPLKVDPSELGGTRHLSAAQFVFEQRDSLALVASQDGRFTVFGWSPCGEGARASGRGVAVVNMDGSRLMAWSGGSKDPPLRKIRVVPRAKSVLIPVLWAVLAITCGGEGGTTAPTPTPSTYSARHNRAEPVSAIAGVVGEHRRITVGQGASTDARGSARHLGRHPVAASRRRTLHRAARGRRARTAADVGEIAVIQDDGTLVAPPNAFDLQGTGLRFAPRAGGYDVSRIDASFQAAIGDPVSLQDDDSTSRTLAFAFTFYGVPQSTAFINSDGNITFGEEDRASTARSVGRLLSGPPRVGPFFADLDPSAGGAVYLRSAPDAFTVTWCGVPVFDSPRRTTFQTSLLPDGTIEMKFAPAPTWTAADGITALAPGRSSAALSPVDLSATSAGAHHRQRRRDRRAVRAAGQSRSGRRGAAVLFDAPGRLRSARHLDRHRLTTRDAFAFEVTVANEVRGHRVGSVRSCRRIREQRLLAALARQHGCAREISRRSVCRLFFSASPSPSSLMGQEAGHRWLAFLGFRDHTGERSEALLENDDAHWSFFFNSDASVMEGNRIEDFGGGQFPELRGAPSTGTACWTSTLTGLVRRGRRSRPFSTSRIP